MYKHNRNRPHETRIPVGLPLDIEGAKKYLKDHLGRDVPLELRQVENMLNQTATDEDLE